MNYFIDCGAYKGLYINRFKAGLYYKPDFKIIAFECNPLLKGFEYSGNVDCRHEAIWIYDGEINFYIAKRNPSFVQGSSVYKKKTTGNLDTENPLKIKCIDFSKFLKDTVTKFDNVIVKMNIEGAEYKVLEKCVADSTINLINLLFVSFHHKKINLNEERHLNLIRILRDVDGLKMHSKFNLLSIKRSV